MLGDTGRDVNQMQTSLVGFWKCQGISIPCFISREPVSGFRHPEKVLKATNSRGWGWEVILAHLRRYWQGEEGETDGMCWKLTSER